jgi:hypothetical protein
MSAEGNDGSDSDEDLETGEHVDGREGELLSLV